MMMTLEIQNRIGVIQIEAFYIDEIIEKIKTYEVRSSQLEIIV